MTEEETESLMNSPIHALQAAGPPQLAQPPQVQLPRMPSYAQRSAAPMNHQLPPIQRGIASATANRLPLPPNLLSAALRHPTPQQFRINYQQSAFGQNRLQQVPASLVLNQMAASMQQQRPAAIRPQLVRAQPQPPPPPPPSLMPPLSRTHAGRLEKPINTYIRSPMTVPAFPKPTGGTQKQPMKIKASPELPAGSKISIVPPGSRIVGKVRNQDLV